MNLKLDKMNLQEIMESHREVMLEINQLVLEKIQHNKNVLHGGLAHLGVITASMATQQVLEMTAVEPVYGQVASVGFAMGTLACGVYAFSQAMKGRKKYKRILELHEFLNNDVYHCREDHTAGTAEAVKGVSLSAPEAKGFSPE